MAVTPTTATNGWVNSTVIPKNKNAIDMTMFLRMLTTQLSNQNPLSPMDDASFFGQIAQLGTVQGMDNLNKQAQVSQATSLLGKTVTAVADSRDSLQAAGGLVTGKVTGMQIQNGVYYLSVQEANGGIAQVQMGNIQAVAE
jgi:flagellar basal-body rod modification protein FlgD